jgi:hypothetical protein
LQFARGVRDGKDYAIKFFTLREAFEREDALYSNKVLRDMMPAVQLIEANANSSIRSPSGWPFPPCIVIERGESLDKWAERIRPDFPTILQVRPVLVVAAELLFIDTSQKGSRSWIKGPGNV